MQTSKNCWYVSCINALARIMESLEKLNTFQPWDSASLPPYPYPHTPQDYLIIKSYISDQKPFERRDALEIQKPKR